MTFTTQPSTDAPNFDKCPRAGGGSNTSRLRRDKSRMLINKKRKDNPVCCPSFLLGAGEQVRTANLNLGKVALCQLSYARIKLNYALDCAFLLRQVKLKNRLFSRIFRRRVELFILYTLGNAVVQKHLDKGLYLVDVLRLEYYVKGQGHRIIAA